MVIYWHCIDEIECPHAVMPSFSSLSRFQNLLGYNERLDIYALGVTCCEAANGVVPYAEMPPTLMLLEKLRGAAPRLLDAHTLEAAAEAEGGGTLARLSDQISAKVTRLVKNAPIWSLRAGKSEFKAANLVMAGKYTLN